MSFCQLTLTSPSFEYWRSWTLISRGISAVSNSFWLVDVSTHLGQAQASRKKIGCSGMGKGCFFLRGPKMCTTFRTRGVAATCSALAKGLHDGTELLQGDSLACRTDRQTRRSLNICVTLRIAGSAAGCWNPGKATAEKRLRGAESA